MQPKFTLKKMGKFCRLVPLFIVLFCFFTGKINAQCTWTSPTVYPIPIQDQSSAGVGTNIYSFGGYTNGVATTNSYKFDGTTWTPIAPLPLALIAGAAVSDGTNVYIIGGYSGTAQAVLYRYNVAANTYTTLASSPNATISHAVAITGGKIFKIAGASDGAGTATNVVNIYDIAANTWTTGAVYPAATTWCKGYAQGNFVYVGGGIAGTPTLKTYRYDITANTWNDAAMADLPQTRWGASSDFYNSGFIMAGGVVNGNTVANISNTVLSYDITGDSWSSLPNMVGERYRACAGVSASGLYSVGGVSQTSTAFNGTNINQLLNCVTLVPCSGTPAPGNTVSSLNPVCSAVNFTLSIANTTIGGATFQWQQSTTGIGGTYTDIAGATGATYTTSITTSTAYRCNVRCTASGLTGTSNPLLETVNPPSACYCTAGGTSAVDEKIARVRFNTIDNPSTNTTPYSDFTAISTTVIKGQVIPITVNLSNGFGSDQTLVWIDFNQNGSFSDPGEQVFVSTQGAGPHTGNITIPATALTGSTRMRIRLHDALFGPLNNPCGNAPYGEVEDYTVNIQPCVPIAITGSPSNASIQCGSNASFTVAITGSAPAYSWEYRVNSSAAWQTVPATAPYSGLNSATLTLSNVSQAFNGYQYRALVTGACSAVDFSAAATLTVAAIVPTVTPSSATICVGSVQQLTLTNTLGNADLITEGFEGTTLPAGWNMQNLSTPIGTVPTWIFGDPLLAPAQNGTANSYALGNFNNVAGNNTISNWLITPSVPIKNGDVFKFWTRTVAAPAFPDRLEVRMSTNGASTNVGATNVSVGDFTTLLLTVNPSLTTTGYPSGWTQYTITISTVGTPVTGRFAFRYFVTSGGPAGANSDNIGIDNVVFTSAGGPAQGLWGGPAGTIFTNVGASTPYVTGTPLTTVYVKPTALGVNNYTVNFTTPTPCTSATTTVPVTVISPIASLTNPANTAACLGKNATFSVTQTGGTAVTYQWQQSVDGGVTWTNIAAATTASLTVSGVTAAMNNYRYRVIATASPCGSVTSAAAVLTVNPLPVVTISSSNLSIVPGQTTTITATSTPAAASATSWSWTFNGSPLVPAVATNSISVGIDALGTYQATVTDNQTPGCTNTSNILTIGAAASDHLWIYPNPSTGSFQVRLYYSGAIAERRLVRIYSEDGQLVAQKYFVLSSGTPSYLSMTFDLPRLGAGAYVVKVSNEYNKQIASGVLIIQ